MNEKTLYDNIEPLLASNSVQDVWDRLLDITQTAGFTNILYGFTRFHTSSGFGDTKDQVILTNFGADYMRGYLDERRYRDGPLVKWALKNEGSVSWRYVAENYEQLSDEEKKVVAFNREHGVQAGYTIAYQHALKRSKAAIGMSLKPHHGTQDQADAIWDEHGRDLQILCGIAHLKITSLPLPRQLLTKRQREVLEWVADGKTIADTAEILCLNKATVEKHLRLARESLSVETTAQAVLKASFHNQIYSI